MRREYVIRIINDSGNDTPVKAVTGENEKVGGEVQDSSKGAEYAMKMAKRIVSVRAIVHTVDQIISHQHSMISLETGAQEYGQRASYAYQKVGGFVKSVAMGAVAGSVAGPVGAIAGAAVAAATSIGSELMNYYMRQDEISTKKDLEDISRRMRMTRATVSGRRYSNITEF
ncbi:MAG: hypothetical protein K2N22_04400 [Clostridia bacterium]|nr:hypothetical protein [Clostridia bacterium]